MRSKNNREIRFSICDGDTYRMYWTFVTDCIRTLFWRQRCDTDYILYEYTYR